MTIQQLNNFLILCEEMNFTKAAERLYITRQALRQNITALEKELGCTLFENVHNHLYLTEKGQFLQAEAQPVVAVFHAFQKKIDSEVRTKHFLKLGISCALIPDYLPNLLRFLKEFQESALVNLEHVMLTNDEIAPAILSGELDCGLVMDLSAAHDGIYRQELTSHPASILLSSQNPCFQKEVLELSDLEGQSLYLPGTGAEFSELIQMIQKANIAVNFCVVPNFYQVFYHIMENGAASINRYDPEDDQSPETRRDILLKDVPPLCSSFLYKEGKDSPILFQLYHFLCRRFHRDFK